MESKVEQLSLPDPAVRGWAKRAGSYMLGRNTGLLLALAALLIVIAFKQPSYFNIDNIKVILLQMAATTIVAVGTSYLLISGNVDLSIGSIYSLAAIEAATVSTHVNPWLAAAFGLLVGGCLGTINGLLVLRMSISPLIITLGTMTLFYGVALVITHGVGISNVGGGFTKFGQSEILHVPTPIWIMVVVAAVAQVFLVGTRGGTTIYALGGNRDALHVVGIRVKRAVIILFAVNGIIVGIAAVVTASRFGAANPQFGLGMELTVITAVILGGVAWAGGEGRIVGVVLAVLLLTVVNSAIITLGISPYYANVVTGGLLVTAVALDQLAHEQRARHRKLQAMREARGDAA